MVLLGNWSQEKSVSFSPWEWWVSGGGKSCKLILGEKSMKPSIYESTCFLESPKSVLKHIGGH